MLFSPLIFERTIKSFFLVRWQGALIYYIFETRKACRSTPPGNFFALKHTQVWFCEAKSMCWKLIQFGRCFYFLWEMIAPPICVHHNHVFIACDFILICVALQQCETCCIGWCSVCVWLQRLPHSESHRSCKMTATALFMSLYPCFLFLFVFTGHRYLISLNLKIESYRP